MVCEYAGPQDSMVWGVCRSQDSMVCEYDGLRTVWCVSMMVSGQYGV